MSDTPDSGESEYPRRDAVIHVPAALAFARAHPPGYDSGNVFLFDPDEPHKSAEQIYREMGARMTDPSAVNHNCPFCVCTMTWDLFRAHMEDCYTRNRKRRTFTGATPEAGD